MIVKRGHDKREMKNRRAETGGEAGNKACRPCLQLSRGHFPSPVFAQLQLNSLRIHSLLNKLETRGN